MFLEIDMGNTRIKWRIRTQEEVIARGFIATDAEPDNLAADLSVYRTQVRIIWIASVVSDELEQSLNRWLIHFFSITPVFARSSAKLGPVSNGYENPALLGVDRWLSVVAAYHLFGRACVILSLGTASTVDVVDHRGNHLGGYIAPGLALMITALATGTRRISAANTTAELNDGLGASTSSAICGGCTSMLMGLVDNALKQLRNISGDSSFELVFAGGDAERLIPFYPDAHLINDLVLDGLAYAMQGSSLLE